MHETPTSPNEAAQDTDAGKNITFEGIEQSQLKSKRRTQGLAGEGGLLDSEVNATDHSQHVGDDSGEFLEIPIRLEYENSVNGDASFSREKDTALSQTMIEGAGNRKENHRLGSSPLLVSEKFLKLESSEKKKPINEQLIELRRNKLAFIAAQMDSNVSRMGNTDDEPESARTE